MPSSKTEAKAQATDEIAFHTLIDAVDEGILVHAAQSGALIDANLRICGMFGYSREEFLGFELADLMEGDALSTADALAALRNSVWTDQPGRFEWLCKAKDGRTFFAAVSARGIRRDDGDLMILTARDVTELKRADKALWRDHESLALATASAGIGVWEWDVVANRLVWDDRMYQLYGIRKQDFGGAYEAWQAGLHPDDRAAGVAAGTAAIEGIADFNLEFRVVWPNGEIRHIEGHAGVQRGADGRAVRMIGFNWDITERKRLEEAQRHDREILGVATQSARIGIWEYDLVAGRLVWDDRMYQLYGIRAQDFSGAYDAWQAGLHPDDRAPGDAAIRAAIEGVKDFNIEFRVLWPNGEIHHIEAHALVQAGPDGRAARMIGVNWDITERKRAAETIRLQADQFATMVATTSDAFLVMRQDGAFLNVNDAFCRMSGYSRDELLSMSILDIEPSENHADTARRMATIVQTGFDRFETQQRWKDGAIVTLDASVAFWQEGRQFICFGRDITDRKRGEQALVDSEARLKTVLETNVDGIVMVDATTKKFSFSNRAFCDLVGYGADALSAMDMADVHPDEALSQVWKFVAGLLAGDTRTAPDLPLVQRDGSVVSVEINASPMTLHGHTYLVACLHDVTARKSAEAQIERLARYDSLTGLVNRRSFVEELQHTIGRARRHGTNFAVLYLDLDHFKDVNDTLGHPAGDVLLKELARRLQASVRAGDTVARFGGDEFAIILDDIANPANAATVSERLLGTSRELPDPRAAMAMAAADVAETIVRSATEPVTIHHSRVYSGASVGIAIGGPDSSDAETILSSADLALYRAKSEQRGSYCFFTEEMDAEVHARVDMQTQLREAIAANQFCLFYQPQVDIQTGRIVGLEALVRWNHPTSGLLGPGRFIPEAESNGLIVPLGRWVLQEACRQGRQWLDAGIAPPFIAVNLSGVQFKMPLALEKDIAAIVAESGWPPHRLELELTESVLMETSRDHNDLLLRLRQGGHRLSIDDFGSGYSSLDYLRRFPVDRIKIAQTFIAEIGTQPGAAAIVRAALGLARELNIEVVVEGVETAAQIGLLTAWGGRIVQGYFFARPLPVAEVTALLRVGKIIPAHAVPTGLDAVLGAFRVG